MGNWNIYGILLIMGVFLLLTGIILAQIDITNPLTGHETNIIGWLWSLLT